MHSFPTAPLRFAVGYTPSPAKRRRAGAPTLGYLGILAGFGAVMAAAVQSAAMTSFFRPSKEK